jgi:hypothetical protein
VPPERDRRVEPWPIALAATLLLMVGIGLALHAIAAANPDPLVTRDAHPGMER